MPELSRFFGIVITMFYDDHSPPHFHAFYGGHRLKVDILDGASRGAVPSRVARLVEEWRRLHVDELLDNWNRTRGRLEPTPIAPLE
jgi:hypothetical protein